MGRLNLFWLTFSDGPARNSWDADVVDMLCPETHFQAVTDVPQGEGAVVALPARWNIDHIHAVNNWLKRLPWAVVLLFSDEESVFPWHRLQHPNLRIWVQSPRPDRHKNPSLRFLPVGCPRPSEFSHIPAERQQFIPVGFYGQVNHRQRDEMLAAFKDFPGAEVKASPGFTQGMDRRAYLSFLSSMKVVCAPSGPASADTFRTWEALEAGAIPIVDKGPKVDDQGRAVTGYPPGFWELSGLDIRQVDEWKQAPSLVRNLIADYPTFNNETYAAYQLYKRQLRQRLMADVTELSGLEWTTNDTTVLVPTSPTPNNPSFEHLQITIASIRERTDAEILLMMDGVRSEQAHLYNAYQEYQRQVLWMTNHVWSDVVPIRFTNHLHQVEMTRRTLAYVTTPLIMFIEHDTPLEGELDWPMFREYLHNDYVDLIRLYHEAVMQPEHEHLMGGNIGPELVETQQWSQRPHIAKTDYYRRVLTEHFSPEARSMIEDKLHGVVQDEGWEKHRLALYWPKEGSLKRSGHLDARQDEPKFGMTF